MGISIKDNVEKILADIALSAEKAGRSADEITLLAVTKYHSIEEIREAYNAGLRRFGENRVQEAEQKYSALKSELSGIELDMIGTLQRNKVNKSVGFFDSIQSVDSIELLAALLSRAAVLKARLNLFFELRTGEDSKSGFIDETSLWRACERFALEKTADEKKAQKNGEAGGLENVHLVGLMTMAPFTKDESRIRRSFSSLRNLHARVRDEFKLDGFRELSMGMSGDYGLAVQEGSTIVRIGTAIFGERKR